MHKTCSGGGGGVRRLVKRAFCKKVVKRHEDFGNVVMTDGHLDDCTIHMNDSVFDSVLIVKSIGFSRGRLMRFKQTMCERIQQLIDSQTLI